MYDRENRLVDRRELLKIKLKSLAAEARIIRHEELKTWGPLQNEMYRHRMQLRDESHLTLLAYQIVRGKITREFVMAYLPKFLAKTVELYSLDRHVNEWLSEIDAMVAKYGTPKAAVTAPARPLRLDWKAWLAKATKRNERRKKFEDANAAATEAVFDEKMIHKREPVGRSAWPFSS